MKDWKTPLDTLVPGLIRSLNNIHSWYLYGDGSAVPFVNSHLAFAVLQGHIESGRKPTAQSAYILMRGIDDALGSNALPDAYPKMVPEVEQHDFDIAKQIDDSTRHAYSATSGLTIRTSPQEGEVAFYASDGTLWAYVAPATEENEKAIQFFQLRVMATCYGLLKAGYVLTDDTEEMVLSCVSGRSDTKEMDPLDLTPAVREGAYPLSWEDVYAWQNYLTNTNSTDRDIQCFTEFVNHQAV